MNLIISAVSLILDEYVDVDLTNFVFLVFVLGWGLCVEES